MAVFNPQQQYNDPNYLNYSKPISQPMADKSTGMALAAVGEGISDAVKITDTAIKDNITSDIHKKVDKAQDEFLGTLDSILAGKKNPLDARAEASDADLMATPDSDVPADVKAAVARGQSIQDAYNQGKMNKLQYDQKLWPMLKSLRADNPGYRDYVDQQFSKITGRDVANQLMTDKLAQINASMTNAQKEQAYWEKQIVSSGFDKSTQVLEDYKAGKIQLPQVQNWLAKNNEAQSKIAAQKAEFELSDKARSDLTARAEITAQSAADHAATSYFRNRQLTADSQTSQQISDMLADLAVNPQKRDPEAIRNLGIQIQMLRARNYAETDTYLRSVKTKDGQSVAQVLGPTRMKAILDNTIGKLYDVQLQLINDNQLGLVNSTQNAAADVVNSATFRVLKDPSTAGIASTAAALNKIAPNLSPELTNKVWGTNTTFATDLLKLQNEQAKQALAQTGGYYSGPRGNIYTFKQFQEEQDKAAGLAKSTPKEQAQAAEKQMAVTKSALLEKDPRVVDNAITHFFDPSNRGTMNKYMDDYFDPNRRVIVKGRTSAFTEMTDPAVTKVIWDRAHSGNGTAWEFYKGWAHSEAVSGLTTLAKTWNTNEEQFAKQQFIRAAEGGKIPSGTDHHFYWDTTTHQIGITDINGVPMDLEKSWRLNPDLFLVRNANKTIQSLRNIAETENKDPKYVDAFIFKTLKDAGWAPRHIDAKGGTIPDRILKAITTGNTEPEPEKK